MRTLSVTSFSIVALWLASCGGGSAEEPGPGPGAGEGGGGGADATSGGDTAGPHAAATGDPADLPAMPEGLTGPTTPWAQMSPEDRGQYMAEHVVPVMRPLFAAYDATRFSDVRCGTCHGPNARAEHFQMPSPSLPPLPRPDDTAAWQALQTREPRAMAFMGSRVVQGMAQLLGEAPYDPATHQGFGCFECHTQAQ